MVVLSGFHIEEILAQEEAEISISLDLGLTRTVVQVDDPVIFPDGQTLSLAALRRVLKKRKLNDCFLIEGGDLHRIYAFDGRENHTYKLFSPTLDSPPSLWIDDSLMHAVARVTPLGEAREKVKALGFVSGIVLETCFGLGYCTGVLLEKGAEQVLACEISADVLAMARLNPWSRAAFENSRVQVNQVDVLDFVGGLGSDTADLVLHDPPTLHRAGDLFSGEFYAEIFRVMKKGATLYHYVGTDSERAGHRYVKGVAERLRGVGFAQVSPAYRGLCAKR